MLLASGWRELPTHTANFDLGQTSLSALGVLGVAIEVLIIGESGFFKWGSKKDLFIIGEDLNIWPR
jgi:hypothetical protein